MIHWFRSVLAVLTGRLTIDKYVYANERWFYYKNECERLAKASEYHEKRANAAVKMFNEHSWGQKIEEEKGKAQ